MKIASAGLLHETNTFAVTPTTLDDFVRDSGGDPDFPADSIATRFAGTATIHGGFFEEAERRGVTLLPLFHALATPSGVIEQTAYHRLRETLLSRLEAVLPVDGVLLDLHGAMVTQAHEDAEGDLLSAVRQRVGPGTPVVATFDLHGNITAQMAETADVLIGFDTYPHVDMHERGVEACRLLASWLSGKIRRPTMAYRQLPLLTMPPLQCTSREPMRTLLERLHALESEPGVLTATLAMGFPFADIHDAGCSVLVTTDDDPALAAAKAEAFADAVWQRRAEFTPKLTTPHEALRYAREEAEGLVILADGSDNPGGGAPCDGTVILRTFIDEDAQDAVVGVLCDPETVAQAHDAGVGATIETVIGGKVDARHGEPVHARAYVRMLGDGEFIHRGPMGTGVVGHLGRTAVLVIGGVEVVVSERRLQLRDAEMLRFVGIEPRHRRLIAVKSAVHFRADFEPLAERIFDADTPGIHRPDFSNYNYQKLRRPMYPLDEV